MAGLAVSLLHAFVDFAWYIPACLAVTTVLVACLLRLVPRSEIDRQDVAAGPTISIAVCALLLLAGTFVLRPWWCEVRSASAWDQYRRTIFENRWQDADADLIDSQLRQLHEVVRHNPNHFSAHQRLANHYFHLLETSRFDTGMPVSHLAATAVTSRFESRQRLFAWRRANLGDQDILLRRAGWHAEQALRECPLLGSVYPVLFHSDVLCRGMVSEGDSYFRQAVLLRPNHGGVLIQAARQAEIAGKDDVALSYCRRAFAKPTHRGRVIELVAPSLSGGAFVDLFAPDLPGLQQLYSYYRRHNRGDDARQITPVYVEHLQSELAGASRERAAAIRRQLKSAQQFYAAGHVSLAPSRGPRITRSQP